MSYSHTHTKICNMNGAGERCRLCLAECGKPLIRICACTQMAYTHRHCIQTFVAMTGQLNCELCNKPLCHSAKQILNPNIVNLLIQENKNNVDVYFVSSALIDRFIVLLLLYLLTTYMQANSSGLLHYLLARFLVNYALFYLMITGSRIADVFLFVMACEKDLLLRMMMMIILMLLMMSIFIGVK